MPKPMGNRITDNQLRIVPANEASAEDVQRVFGTKGNPAGCQCQWFKRMRAEHRGSTQAERRKRLEKQANFGDPLAATTVGLVAYLGDEPVGWCAIEPRSTYVRLRAGRVVWAGRQEDPADDSVWAVSCFVTREGYRRRGISYVLVRAAIDFARERGAAAVEGYPLITGPGKEANHERLYVGNRNVFAAGFTEVSHPTERRVVMRINL